MVKYCNCERFYKVDEFKKGAKIKFKELPIKLTKELSTISNDEFTIKSVLFRINQNSELSVVIELSELPGRYFNPSVFKAIRTDIQDTSLSEDERTLNKLIEKINDLSAENSFLRNYLNHSLNGNFEL